MVKVFRKAYDIKFEDYKDINIKIENYELIFTKNSVK